MAWRTSPSGPAVTSHTRVGAATEISSSPSSPRTTRARTSRRRSTSAMTGARVSLAHPMRALGAPPGVRERPQDVEHRGEAQLAAGRTGVTHRRVERLGEAEADAGPADAGHDVLRSQVDDDPELLEHVCGAGRRRGGPIAVLDDRCPAGRADERGHRRDVDRVRLVAARAHDVERDGCRLRPEVEEPRVAQHHRDEGIHLGRRLALGPQRGHEAGDLGRRRRSAEDLLHRPGGGVGREVLAAHEAGQDRRPGVLGERHASGVVAGFRRPWRRRAGGAGGSSRDPRAPPRRSDGRRRRRPGTRWRARHPAGAPPGPGSAGTGRSRP